MRRLHTVFILPVLLVALLASAGCGSKEEVAPVDMEVVKKELFGKVWVCEMLFQREAMGDEELTLEFMPDGTIKGFGGCNTFTGEYTLDGENLRFGPLLSTKKHCGAATGEQEFTYMSFLSTITKLKIDDDELRLINEDIPVPMLFTTGGGGLW